MINDINKYLFILCSPIPEFFFARKRFWNYDVWSGLTLVYTAGAFHKK